MCLIQIRGRRISLWLKNNFKQSILNFQKINMQYDLEERCSVFAENVVVLCKKIKLNDLNKSIIIQLIRSATSIGANYMEANGASSKKDFKNKIFICLKEARETKHWLRLLARLEEEHIRQCRILWQEVHELCLIFGKISSSC
ncbi:MAG: hypothetical protein UV02_C0039G0017 [Candidatus Kuenenbacteria bacterium GW2011_GWA2_42_15]|uniref:Four helix bundle protein n=2 Tax=Candidatus Kueneniibacteriota TaxID=1752740 RepID=A0A0G0YVG2_9BACT|nr:MAG: hypothetical protein UV02_C0039G0017 [Candidatus Kuenenbacteria bacterium GW2011_GWA2_42_15]HLD38093.1 four helix bundle protein [Candidatus Nanoarchaeia archaeon]